MFFKIVCCAVAIHGPRTTGLLLFASSRSTGLLPFALPSLVLYTEPSLLLFTDLVYCLLQFQSSAVCSPRSTEWDFYHHLRHIPWANRESSNPEKKWIFFLPSLREPECMFFNFELCLKIRPYCLNGVFTTVVRYDKVTSQGKLRSGQEVNFLPSQPEGT